MIKIRLKITGNKKQSYFNIIVTNNKSPRDGKFIEKLGYFNIINIYNKKHQFYINIKRTMYWISNGAKCSKRVIFLLKKNNIKYK